MDDTEMSGNAYLGMAPEIMIDHAG